MMREEAKNKGKAALALGMPFDEYAILAANLPYLCATLSVAKVHLYTDVAEGPQPEVQQAAVPGKPQPHFYFSEDLSGPPPSAPAFRSAATRSVDSHASLSVASDADSAHAAASPATRATRTGL